MSKRISYITTFLRGLVIVVDLSEVVSIKSAEFTPNKLEYLYETIRDTGIKYFEQNLISSLIIIGVYDYKSHLIVPASYDDETFLQSLSSNWPKIASGQFSLYNSFYVSFHLKFSSFVKSTCQF